MSYAENIQWVNEYVNQIKPYIFVRETDRLLIKIPNEAFKLNEQGIRILNHLLQGGDVMQIVDAYADREQIAEDIHYFFCDLKLLLKGCYHEQGEYKSIEKVKFGLGFHRFPVLSEIALTYRCNLSCQFCYAGCGCRKTEAREMNAEQAFRILDIIRYEAQVPSVSFTGGEPVLRGDLIRIIRYAKSLNMWTNLITNGTLISADFGEKLKQAGLDSAQVSLEAGTDELHDRIVGHSGAFRKTLNGLEALMKAGIRVHTNTTISGLNRNHLENILILVKNLDLNKLSMNLMMPVGSSLKSLHTLLVKYSDVGPLILNLYEKARSLNLELMWYSPTPVCLFNPVIHGLGNKGCAACDGLLSVAPNGDILPCSSYPEPVGNLLDESVSFQEIWNSERSQYFQQKRYAHKKCLACEDLALCQGGCPLYWQQVGYEEILEGNHALVS
jgi:radical SAM protein with 4Fe4S-binding SPASM domain